MRNRLFSLAALALIIGSSIALAQTQVDIEGQATAVGQGTASATSTASGSSHSSGAASSVQGMKVANGMVNGQRVFVIDFSEKAASAASTDGARSAVKDHESSYLNYLNQQGVLLIAGTYGDDGKRSMTIMAKDQAAAQKFATDSPLVGSGYYLAKVRPYHVVLIGSPKPTKEVKLDPQVDTVTPPRP